MVVNVPVLARSFGLGCVCRLFVCEAYCLCVVMFARTHNACSRRYVLDDGGHEALLQH